MSLPSRNLYKCKQFACSVVVACLFVDAVFYTDVVLAYLFLYFLVSFVAHCMYFTSDLSYVSLDVIKLQYHFC